MGVPLTGWATTDAVRQVECPKCGQKPGDYCRTPKNRKAWPPHAERVLALTKKLGGCTPLCVDGNPYSHLHHMDEE